MAGCGPSRDSVRHAARLFGQRRERRKKRKSDSDERLTVSRPLLQEQETHCNSGTAIPPTVQRTFLNSGFSRRPPRPFFANLCGQKLLTAESAEDSRSAIFLLQPRGPVQTRIRKALGKSTIGGMERPRK